MKIMEKNMNQKMDDLFKNGQEWVQNNQLLIRGYGFMAVGLFLVYLTFKIFLNVLLFTAGVVLIYDASKKLDLQKLSSYIEKVLTFFGCNCSK